MFFFSSSLLSSFSSDYSDFLVFNDPSRQRVPFVLSELATKLLNLLQQTKKRKQHFILQLGRGRDRVPDAFENRAESCGARTIRRRSPRSTA